jgi:hypothetical protein
VQRIISKGMPNKNEQSQTSRASIERVPVNKSLSYANLAITLLTCFYEKTYTTDILKGGSRDSWPNVSHDES